VSAALRNALARFASGAVVVSARAEGGVPRSVLASAFNSVSLAPAIVLWCVPAESADWITVDRAYGLSVLSGFQAPMLDGGLLCSKALAAWEYGEMLGAPILRDAAAWFEVVPARRIPHGDHALFLAEVAGFGYEPARSGLLRYSGEVARVAEAFA
jgi:flavin reductase (DIM6/NTAB) family NADH-FMN oxidoreductase RutF